MHSSLDRECCLQTSKEAVCDRTMQTSMDGCIMNFDKTLYK